jgi:hypothetical protein
MLRQKAWCWELTAQHHLCLPQVDFITSITIKSFLNLVIQAQVLWAVVTWGLGSLGETSYRTLFALLSDDIRKKPPKDVAEVAGRWVDKFWAEYSPVIKPCQDLIGKKPFDPTANPPDAATRAKDEEAQFEQLRRGLVGGFCICGYILENRTPEAFVTSFDPLLGKPVPTKLPKQWSFWGAPNMIQRLMFGCEPANGKAVRSRRYRHRHGRFGRRLPLPRSGWRVAVIDHLPPSAALVPCAAVTPRRPLDAPHVCRRLLDAFKA